MNEEDLKTLIESLICSERESEWVEWKKNNANPVEIGEYLSAISNSAALHDRDSGFLVWGLTDSREVVGTTFQPRDTRIGNEELENWLAIQLHPKINFRFYEIEVSDRRLVVLEVPAASHAPVRFRDTAFIRVGSYKKKLKDHPEKEKTLWSRAGDSFEQEITMRSVSSDSVLDLLDYPSYFTLMDLRLPDTRVGILDRLVSEKLITSVGTDRFNITNLGGILFAKDLDQFDGLSRKTVRVIVYEGNDRTKTLREREQKKGYASGFSALIGLVNDQLPENEHIERALREEVRMYPEIAIRELVANALIHQDFSLGGTGPMIEIFEDRVEITNPGTPLIEPDRFLDAPPQSRNEALARKLRRLNICEERGSGIDKVIGSIEMFQLPALDFRVSDRHTKVLLFAHKSFAQMDKQDRIRACYQHAGLMWVANKQMTNTSLRERFSISNENYSTASRVIRDTINANLVKPYDPTSKSKKNSRYVPFWA